MQNTNWPAFGIGMAAGVALSISLYFGWTLLRPAPREADNGVAATSNLPMPLDENALVAANAERPANAMRPPPQLQPEAEPTPEPAPVVRAEPPVVRPTPRPEPYDPPPEDDPPPDEDLDKPTE